MKALVLIGLLQEAMHDHPRVEVAITPEFPGSLTLTTTQGGVIAKIDLDAE